MDAFLYRRISTTEERQDIDRQLQPLLNYCKDNKLKVIDDFKDSVSGSVAVAKRSGYSKMLKAVDRYPNKKNLNIVFDEISRLGRKKKIINDAIEFFTNQGINVHFLSPTCKILKKDGTIDEQADLIITIFAQLAESELNRFKHRTVTSVPRTAEKGHSLGGYFALGYTTDDVGKIIIHEEEAKLVKLIFNMYTTGNGASKIAKYLNHNKYPSKMGRQFEPSTILRIIKNRNYIGEREVLGVRYKIDRIIDDKTFHQANNIRASNRNYRTHMRVNVNPFVGLLKCACGSTIRVRKKPDRTPVGKLSFVCNDSNNGIKVCKNFSTIDYNLLCNSVLSFFEKIINDYTGDDELLRQLNQELKIKKSEYYKVTSSILKLQDAEDDLFFEKSKGNIDNNRFKRLQKRLYESNKKDVQKEKVLKSAINDIEEKIELINSKREIDKINDIYDLKFFSQKFIKTMTINTVDRKTVPKADKYYKDKRSVIYEVKIDSITGLHFNFFVGSLSRIIYWNAYNRDDSESYKQLWTSLKSGWHGGTIIDKIEMPNKDVFLVRKNVNIFDIRHGNHYNAIKEADLKKNN